MPFHVRVHIAIPYHTATFKSVNSVKNVVWGKTTKFNDRQYFRLYSISTVRLALAHNMLAPLNELNIHALSHLLECGY